jgi:hypothetical protein
LLKDPDLVRPNFSAVGRASRSNASKALPAEPEPETTDIKSGARLQRSLCTGRDDVRGAADEKSYMLLIAIWGEWGEIFSIMAQIGFFRRTGDRYQMIVPKRIRGSEIEAALLNLAGTEDEDFLHPERSVTCVSKSDAKKWQLRLERLPWQQRLADRALLLEELGCRPHFGKFGPSVGVTRRAKPSQLAVSS